MINLILRETIRETQSNQIDRLQRIDMQWSPASQTNESEIEPPLLRQKGGLLLLLLLFDRK